MSSLTNALKSYCQVSKSKSTLHGFFGKDNCRKELIATWFELHTDYEDAMKLLMRKSKQVY
ncbi:hypothetical protein INT48_007485 [Thamnidium elegans]|uniref:Uncharacterized protein n=1 Tax=Thamnidium elegans TaxID=101142 RepID=A0A8H7SMW8_9FUNG|nr:hypothetical protein INT48_007485 [Thamnidium elegans]